MLVQVLHASKSHTLQLVSDSNIGPRSLHMLLEPTNRGSTLEEETAAQLSTICVVLVHQGFLVLIGGPCLWPIATKGNHVQ